MEEGHFIIFNILNMDYFVGNTRSYELSYKDINQIHLSKRFIRFKYFQ